MKRRLLLFFVFSFALFSFFLVNGSRARRKKLSEKKVPVVQEKVTEQIETFAPKKGQFEVAEEEVEEVVPEKEKREKVVPEVEEEEKISEEEVEEPKPKSKFEPTAVKAKPELMLTFDEKAFVKQRRKASMDLVQKGIEYFKEHDEVESFRAFTFDKDFVRGELYLFVYNLDGVCLAHGDQSHLIWQNLYNFQDEFGSYVVREFIDKAKKGGGWVTYTWKNATKISYVKAVKKNKQTYVFGCGFYPHSKKDAVVNLVDGAVSLFNQIKKAGGPVTEAFSRFNYPAGRFVVGNHYLFALDFEGVIMAQGERPGLIGQNSIDHKDAKGKYINKEIIAAVKKHPNGAWVDYVSKRAPKVAYARKVTDRKGKNYFIACGFYPTANRKATMDLVRRGYRYLKMHGIARAKTEFTSKTNMEFRFGDLYLFLYDMRGKVIADGGNPDLVGKVHYNLKDDDGKYYVREMLEKAKAGGGWMDYRLNNAPRFVYVELVQMGTEQLVIGCGLYPIAKPETMQLLVKGGVSLLKDVTREKAFEQISEPDGRFVSGDLSLFVFGFKGICYVYEEDPDYIWRDLYKAKDDEGRLVVQEMIKVVKDGPSIITYKLGGVSRFAYVEKAVNNGTPYVVGSSFAK